MGKRVMMKKDSNNSTNVSEKNLLTKSMGRISMKKTVKINFKLITFVVIAGISHGFIVGLLLRFL